MINKVILSGRIAADVEVRQAQNGAPVVRFPLAVEREYSRQNEQKQTDFPYVTAWGKTAEFIGKYFTKGKSIVVIGQIRTSNYTDNNGTKHFVTEVYADQVQFTFEKNTSSQPAQNGQNGGHQQGYNYPPAQGQPPQTGAQPPFQQNYRNNGDFEAFGTYNEDGLPF